MTRTGSPIEKSLVVSCPPRDVVPREKPPYGTPQVCAGLHGYRWRRLTPGQAAAVRAAATAGADVGELARAYGVNRRTIYRAIERAATEITVEVQIDEWRAEFAVGESGPVQVTPWVPKP